ncbi:MAG: DUF362 domain-containing protein, partial [Chloroflexi bacterium]|nr:DUF362 domain-containing protein [Chloroflexota bacterium]
DDVRVVGKKRVLIKPNFVSVHRPLAATHVDAVRAVLDVLQARGVGEVTLAGNPASGSFEQGLRNYGFTALLERYPIRVVDLKQDETVEVWAYDGHLRPKLLRVARTMVESDYRISVGPPKTHDIVLVTLSLKNMAVGSLPHKSSIHAGPQGTNLNLYKLAPYVAPHLAIIDGYRGMEGSGPVSGDPVEWRIAIASTDFVAADSLAAQLMGFQAGEVGYIHYCALRGLGHERIEEMEIVGNISVAEARHPFRRHPGSEEQVRWRIPEVERYL